MAELTSTFRTITVCSYDPAYDYLHCVPQSEPVEGLVASGLKLLPSLWADKPMIRGLLQALLNTFQNPLDLIFEILEKTSLFNAEGIQLDTIGRLWSTPRGLLDDEEYRDELFKVVIQDVADGTPESVVALVKSFINKSDVYLYEHMYGDVHIFCNVGYNPKLKTFGKLIVPVGVNFSAMFPSFETGKGGVKPSANAYVTQHNLLDLENITPSSGVGTSSSTNTAPDGEEPSTTTGDLATIVGLIPGNPTYIMFTPVDAIIDGSTVALSGLTGSIAVMNGLPLVYTEGITQGIGSLDFNSTGLVFNVNDLAVAQSQTVTSNVTVLTDTSNSSSGTWGTSITPIYQPTNKYFTGVFVEKTGVGHNVLLRATFTGGDVDEVFDYEINVATGNTLITANQPPSLHAVTDIGDYYFIWMEIRSTNRTHTGLDVQVYPVYGTVLGTQDITETGSSVVWGLTVAVVNDDLYYSKVLVRSFKCSEIISSSYDLVDSNGDNIVDSNDNLMVVTKYKEFILPGATRLGEYNNSEKGHPFVEVI